MTVKKITIVAVDDEPGILEIYIDLFKDQLPHVTLLTFENPEEVLKLNPEEVDMLISDYSMPQMTGVALIEKFRAKQFMYRDVVVTGHAPAEVENLDKGSILFLEKLQIFNVIDYIKLVLNA